MTARHGFTLIELLLVIIILSVILGFNLPNFSKARDQMELRQAADRVVYAIRYGRSRAITESRFIKMAFDQDTYALQYMPDEESNQDGGRLPGKMGEVFELPSSIHFQSAPGEIVFYPDGQVDKVRFSLTAKQGEYTISTKEIPGHAVVLESTEGL